jgi:starvation-inducible DNA-binding protein
MHATRNDLPAKARTRVIALLASRLTDTIALRLAVKQAHWNVKGPGFMELHEQFDELAGRLDGHADELAERIAALGGTPLGSASALAGSPQSAYADQAVSGPEHLRALADRVAALAKTMRAGIELSAKAGDEVSADLCNEITGGLDKDLWFLEAHLQTGR